MTPSDSLIGRHACGCITYWNGRPDDIDRASAKRIAEFIREGGEMVRVNLDDVRDDPNFIPLECPHTPKGWEKPPPPRTDVHFKSFSHVRGRGVSRPKFANIKAGSNRWETFGFGEVRKWDGKWWATDGWFNYQKPGAHNGMLDYQDHPEGRDEEDRPALHLGPFDSRREAADALVPHCVEYAQKLVAEWDEQRRAKDDGLSEKAA